MVVMASGIARGRVRTTTTESRNMAAILQIIGWQYLVDRDMQPWFTVYFFDILDIHVMINWHLSKQGICWPVSRDHIAGSSVQLIEVTCFLKLTADQVLVFDWIAGSCQVNLLKTGQDCSEVVGKPVNASPGFKFFSSKLQNSNQHSNRGPSVMGSWFYVLLG